jgi:hypothetical protein
MSSTAFEEARTRLLAARQAVVTRPPAGGTAPVPTARPSVSRPVDPATPAAPKAGPVDLAAAASRPAVDAPGSGDGEAAARKKRKEKRKEKRQKKARKVETKGGGRADGGDDDAGSDSKRADGDVKGLDGATAAAGSVKLQGRKRMVERMEEAASRARLNHETVTMIDDELGRLLTSMPRTAVFASPTLYHRGMRARTTMRTH